MTTARHTWFMVMRQVRNLMREPIWIVTMVIQPMVWLILYGQLFKNVTRLGGFGTTSYVTFLAPAVVIMNGFFSASWSGMSMIGDLEHKVIERFLATPVSRLSIVLSQIVRSALTAGIQGLVILLVALALGVRIHAGALGWLVIIVAGMLVNSAFAGFSQGIALLTRREASMIAVANAISLPLLFLSTTTIAKKQMPGWMQFVSRFNPVEWGVRAARSVALPGTSWSVVGWHLLLLLTMTAVTSAWALRALRSYERTL